MTHSKIHRKDFDDGFIIEIELDCPIKQAMKKVNEMAAVTWTPPAEEQIKAIKRGYTFVNNTPSDSQVYERPKHGQKPPQTEFL